VRTEEILTHLRELWHWRVIWQWFDQAMATWQISEKSLKSVSQAGARTKRGLFGRLKGSLEMEVSLPVRPWSRRGL
jgi:tRNA U34 5-methylaminomethyl-2-thiouridine-forming methyltransferase MnmC